MIYSILTQILPVMLGVYLGFAVNNWGEARQQKAKEENYKLMLINEVEQNLKSIQKAQTYHKQLTEDFNRIYKSEDVQKAFGEYNMRGLQPGFVTDSGYNTGLQTGIIQGFDLKLVQKINNVYNLQEDYDSYNESMLDAFLNQDFPETEKDIKNIIVNLKMHMNDVATFESNLKKMYEDLLENL